VLTVEVWLTFWLRQQTAILNWLANNAWLALELELELELANMHFI
jgi:hypothetical protein